jgi:hypothetical protein
MRPAITLLGMKRETAVGVIVAAAFMLVPSGALAQRGGVAAHPAGPNAGVIRAPQAPVSRAPVAPNPTRVIGQPNVSSPRLTRPMPMVTRPMGIGSLAPLRPTLGYSAFVPTRLPRGFPRIPTSAINPLARNGFYGLASSALFYGCSGFGWGLGCPMAGLYSGLYGFPNYGFPTLSGPAYPPDGSYPSADPTYMPADPTAALQFESLPNQPISLGSLPGDLSSAGTVGARLAPESLLYCKDGSVFAIGSYTVSAGKLHYVTSFGDEGEIDVAELDVPKTIRANAASGVSFTLTPGLGGSPHTQTPALSNPSPAAPGPIYPPKP